MQSGEATQECLDGLLLEEAGTGKTFILNPNENENEGGNPSVFFKLRRPTGYVCNHCVIQVRELRNKRYQHFEAKLIFLT